MTGEIVWKPAAATIKAALLRGYTFNNTHKFVSQVTGAGGVLVATTTLTNLTFANGVAGADNVTYPVLTPCQNARVRCTVSASRSFGAQADQQEQLRQVPVERLRPH